MSVNLGGRYVGRGGKAYTVLGVEGSYIRIRYVGGDEARLRLAEHLINQRIASEKAALRQRFNRRIARVKSQVIDLYTLGFLVPRAYLNANMPLDYEQQFVDMYQELAGENPSQYSISADHTDKWAISTEIVFYATQEELDYLDFGELEVHQNYAKQENRWGVYNNNYFWALISMGFRTGSKKHDLNKIRSQLHVSRESIGDFERGLGAGRNRG